MGDQRLRERERRRTDTVDDEAGWLVERLRAGSLTRERLDLAAWCGHEAAIRAGGMPGPHDPEAWLGGLEVLSPALAVWALAEGLTLLDEDPSWLASLRRGARDAFLRDDGLEFARSTTARNQRQYRSTEAQLVYALHQLMRDARRADPGDADVRRALESVRPRFPFLDPGTWRYAWSERAPLGGWAHSLEYVRERGGASEQLVQAAHGWTPQPGSPRVSGLVLRTTNHLDGDAVRRIVVLDAVRWALGPSWSDRGCAP